MGVPWFPGYDALNSIGSPLRSALAHYRSLVQVAALAVCFCALPGCIAFYSYRDVVLEIRDGDTGEPYAHLVVTTSYPPQSMFQSIFVLNLPEGDGGKTGEDGQVVLRMATYPGSLFVYTHEFRNPIRVDASYVRDGGVLEHSDLYSLDRDPWNVTIAFNPK